MSDEATAEDLPGDSPMSSTDQRLIDFDVRVVDEFKRTRILANEIAHRKDWRYRDVRAFLLTKGVEPVANAA